MLIMYSLLQFFSGGEEFEINQQQWFAQDYSIPKVWTEDEKLIFWNSLMNLWTMILHCKLQKYWIHF